MVLTTPFGCMRMLALEGLHHTVSSRSWSLHKLMGIYMASVILGNILQYMIDLLLLAVPSGQ